MGDAPVIVGTWLHSYEEDTQDAAVYRPSSFPMPPSRGRPGMRFDPDGTFFELGPGVDDRGSARQGLWRDVGPGEIEISFPGSSRQASVRRVLACQDDVLRIARERDV
jgi:hypothetical protein